MTTTSLQAVRSDAIGVSRETDKPSVAVSSTGNVRLEWAMQDLNLRPPACRAEGPPSQSIEHEPLAAPLPAVCTPVCCENAPGSNVEALAKVITALTPAERARLAALLAGPAGEEGGDR
jgi:hypothetical protein